MIGTVLYGYCGGYFGRDSYSNKRIEAIGVDWVVVRTMDDSGFPEFVCGEGIHEELKEYTDPKHKI